MSPSMKRSITIIVVIALAIVAAIILSPNQTEYKRPWYVKLSSEEIAEWVADVGYHELLRHPEKYRDSVVVFTGEVVQTIETKKSGLTLRVGVEKRQYLSGKDWYSSDEQILVSYSGERLIKGDIIEVIGIFIGTETYESVLNAKYTVPRIRSVRTKILKKAGED
jgi:hypothetical protein